MNFLIIGGAGYIGSHVAKDLMKESHGVVVLDNLAETHILAAQRLMDGGENAVYNLGCQNGYSVREILDIARKVTGHAVPAKESGRRSGDPAGLVASSDKIKAELGWFPRYDDPEKIIATAWKWHRAHPDGFGSA